MFEHILVPLDGSTRAEAALPLAARIARATGNSIILLQVASIPMNYGYGGNLGMSAGYGNSLSLGSAYGGGLSTSMLTADKMRESERTDAIDYLTHIAKLELFAGIATTTEVVFGRPASQILTFIEEQKVNLVVLCSHGRTGMRRWMLGSVAQRVIHHSHVPVLVLRDEESTPSSLHVDASRQFRVAVALDGSPLAEAALLPAAHLVSSLNQHTQGVVHLLHVVKESPSVIDDDLIPLRTVKDVEQARAYLQSVREHLLTQTQDLHIQVTCSTTCAQDVAATIVAIADKGAGSIGEYGYDVLALATHGHGGLEQWVMGSVSERVIHAATVPVLVVRPSKDELHA